MISSIRRLSAIASRAWISMSAAWPSKPPQSWWIGSFAFGSAIRLPLAPAASSSAPSDIAKPTPIVAISGLDGDLAGAGELELLLSDPECGRGLEHSCSANVPRFANFGSDRRRQPTASVSMVVPIA
jgi:hypothetical protein